MSSTVGDYLFAKLARVGVRRVFGYRRGCLFIGSIQRNNLAYDDINHMTSTPDVGQIGAFVVSSQPDDLTACYAQGMQYFPNGPVVYIVEHSSAQFDTAARNSFQCNFAATTILNSPSTAISQISRVLDVMSHEGRSVYIGLSLAVAGQQMFLQSPSLDSISPGLRVPALTQTTPRSQASANDGSPTNQALVTASPSSSHSSRRAMEETITEDELDEAARSAVVMSLM